MCKPTRVAAALMHAYTSTVLQPHMEEERGLDPRLEASRDVRVHVRGVLVGILVCGLIKLDFLGEEVDVD